jgi:glycosyltransferase involved in cell wall biosynthesis
MAMKILQVNKWYPPHRGGIETVVRDIAEGLQRYPGVQVEVLVCSPNRQSRTEVRRGVKVFEAGSLGTLFSMPISLKFFTMFRRLAPEYDLIFLHHLFPLGLAAYLLYGRRKPVMVWYHSDIVRQHWAKWLVAPFLQAVLDRAKKIFVSNALLKENSPDLQPYVHKCVVLPFGLKMDRTPAEPDQHKPAEIRQQFGSPLILSVGRLVYYKGFSYLIEAMKEIDGNALIIGSGPLLDKMTGLIRQLGLERKVHIIPPLENLIPYYEAADVFVFPSVAVSETFGLVQLEAMAHGLPVVNTALPNGTTSVSLDGQTGITVSPRDSRALAGAINQLLADPDLRKRLGTTGRQRVEQHFSYDRVVQKLHDELFN